MTNPGGRSAFIELDDPGISAEADTLLQAGTRFILLGAPGTGKSTRAGDLAREMHSRGLRSLCLAADPGLPAFGPPGALAVGEWRGGAWRLIALEALCSLDAGRFRLPLALAAHRLLGTIGALMADRCDVRLLVDTPGVVRGIAASELLSALHAAVVPDAALVLAPGLAGMPFADDLRSWRCPLYVRRPDPGARPLPKGARARRRSALWNAYLRTAVPRSIPGDLPVTGAPPPANAHEAWQGRQAALIAEDGSTVAFGELALSGTGGTQLRVPAGESVTAEGRALLVRDALRSSSGRLETASPARDAVRFSAPPDVLPAAAAAEGPRPIVRIGSLAAALPNGLLGDPLLHVRLGQHRRSLLFDLGEGSRLPARIAHQVSDI
ncbi:MAG: hypothetical protein PVF91_02230, partial [Chromatiales bacterium]